MEEESRKRKRDEFESSLPKDICLCFARVTTVISWTNLKLVNHKFYFQCERALKEKKGYELFSFIFKLPEEKVEELFIRMPSIFSQYFKETLTAKESVNYFEELIREENLVTICLDLYQRLMPRQPEKEKGLIRMNRIINPLTGTALFSDNEVAVFMTLMAFKCRHAHYAFTRYFAEEVIVTLRKDPEDFRRLVDTFVECVNELTTDQVEPATLSLER